MDAEGGVELARRSRGTPRIANRLLRRVRDYAQVKGTGRITLDMANRALAMLDVDPQGFDVMDRKLLEAVIHRFDGGPVGLDNIAASIGEEAGTIEDVIEPYLIQQGFLRRTPRGASPPGCVPAPGRCGAAGCRTVCSTRKRRDKRPRGAGWWLGAGALLVVLACCPSAGRVSMSSRCARRPVAYLQFSARVATLSRVEIGSTVTGAWRVCGGGAQVRAGDALVQLESEEWQAALVQAQATEQRQTRARLAGCAVRAAWRRRRAPQADATVRAAQAHLDRVEPLVAQGFYSAAQRDEPAAHWMWPGPAGRARAQSQALAEAGTDMAQAQAQWDVARAAVVAARARLAQATLRAHRCPRAAALR